MRGSRGRPARLAASQGTVLQPVRLAGREAQLVGVVVQAGERFDTHPAGPPGLSNAPSVQAPPPESSSHEDDSNGARNEGEHFACDEDRVQEAVPPEPEASESREPKEGVEVAGEVAVVICSRVGENVPNHGEEPRASVM